MISNNDHSALLSQLEVHIVNFPANSMHLRLIITEAKFKFTIIAVTEGVIEIPTYDDYTARNADVVIFREAILLKAIDGITSKLFVVRFTEQFVRDHVYDFHSPTIEKLFKARISKFSSQTNNFKLIKRLLHLLYKHHNISAYPNSLVICQLSFNLLLSCIIDMEDIIEPEAKLSASHKIMVAMKFVQMVQENVQEQHGVKFYAAALCMTQGNLTRIIKNVTGKGPKSLIEEELLKKSEAILDGELLTIYIVAEQLGFKSSSSFINFFRFHKGCTPTEYRNRKNR